MHEAAPYPAPYGTPIDGLDFGEVQFRSALTKDVVMASGISSTVAHMVAEETGDRITWPFHTIGFLDAVPRVLIVVIHHGSGVPGEAELSISDSGLPPSRAILRELAARLFLDCRQTGVTVRVCHEDQRLQATLSRLGFRASGRDDRAGPAARLIFTLDAVTGLRRAFPRGIIPHARAT